ncbi:MAG: tetratricopeptide repeat protein [Bradymonadaceae bacterium]
MRRAVVTVIVTVVGLGAGVSSASAQTMEFGADEAEEVGGDESKGDSSKGEGGDKKAAASDQAKSFLKEGKKLYKNKKYDQASLIFYKIINKDKLAAETIVPEARYQLGKTLFRMELYQGALSQFGKIIESGESHPYYVPTLNGLLSLAEVIPAEPSLRKYLAKYADLFPQQVPEKYRDRYAYLVGRHFYNQAANKKAVKMLKYVSQRSPLYAKARYILAITHVSTYSAKPAVQSFKQVLQQTRQRRLAETGRAKTSRTGPPRDGPRILLDGRLRDQPQILRQDRPGVAPLGPGAVRVELGVFPDRPLQQSPRKSPLVELAFFRQCLLSRRPDPVVGHLFLQLQIRPGPLRTGRL